MAHEFEFVDELPAKEVRRRPDGLLEEFAATLRAHPGTWAKWPIKEGAPHANATDIKNGWLKPFRGGSFDAQARNAVLYVRYVGEVSTDDA